MNRMHWTERIFTFGIPAGWLQNVAERLHGTPARLKELTASLTEHQAALRRDGAWSVKEHIGHLSDMEELHDGRIDDFLQKKETLRAADMKNEKTWKANHNERDLKTLIDTFSEKREHYINRLLRLDDKTLNHAATHPRLGAQVTPTDMAFFTAEHDDHHLCTIREIISG